MTRLNKIQRILIQQFELFSYNLKKKVETQNIQKLFYYYFQVD